MKIILAILLFTLFSFGAISQVFAVTLEVFTDNKVYNDGKPLFVYGKALPNETLIVRLFSPDGTISKFDQVTVSEDGSFNHVLLYGQIPPQLFPTVPIQSR